MLVLNLKKKLMWGAGLLVLAVVVLFGSAIYMLTRPLDVEFAQDPNVVEASEANRKLKLFNEAQAAKRQGFVRLSEVEINSFLDGRYNSGKHARTNEPVQLAKTGVLLGPGTLTFVTWYRRPVLGLDLPFVWQRVVSPVKETNGWSFALQAMRLGSVDVPEKYWGTIEKYFGANDAVFEERRVWLQNLPQVTMARNEQSKAPELRLYTYVPEDKSKQKQVAAD